MDIKERGLRERNPVHTSQPKHHLHQEPGSARLLECGVQVGGFGKQLGLFLVDSVTLISEQSCRPSGHDFLSSRAKQPTSSHLSVLGRHVEHVMWIYMIHHPVVSVEASELRPKAHLWPIRNDRPYDSGVEPHSEWRPFLPPPRVSLLMGQPSSS
ncbi:hypothetical protein GE21DRAFT_7010 [Neurospora crassa]|uniref:Uncharacterized protein n=1 Tax=Neurospora crassa (strain ATCC 24698 / 74-OR23-1A / CBS 708.71 / DSM 1257 / FGSC 987) TaxID=367110 RepID=V5IL81_NEUCR|nr:hypothetical protein NCU16941 [Neurospora crassa OR74A]ESA42382.1 hypothetical protein NCU16941 [Neurospora crassa OR74A]KHE79260.1 hypothetical protein GE21DRAFT_7010 [Neurospora crassa]|eukprot:XP_011394814.1 hypothetical protein NCU16941 [Neurospora crassa OR74A]